VVTPLNHFITYNFKSHQNEVKEKEVYWKGLVAHTTSLTTSG